MSGWEEDLRPRGTYLAALPPEERVMRAIHIYCHRIEFRRCAVEMKVEEDSQVSGIRRHRTWALCAQELCSHQGPKWWEEVEWPAPDGEPRRNKDRNNTCSELAVQSDSLLRDIQTCICVSRSLAAANMGTYESLLYCARVTWRIGEELKFLSEVPNKSYLVPTQASNKSTSVRL